MKNNSKQPRPEYKSDKCEVSGRYFVVGGQMAGCRHILTGLHIHLIVCDYQIKFRFISFAKNENIYIYIYIYIYKTNKKKVEQDTKHKRNKRAAKINQQVMSI